MSSSTTDGAPGAGEHVVSHGPAGSSGAVATPSATALPRPTADMLIGLCLAGALTLLAFATTGGFDESIIVSAADTWSEIAITLLGAGACATMLVLGARGRAWGGVTVALFALVTVYTALSIAWSVQPDNSWQAANLTLAYLAAFAGAASLARLAPERWRALLGAVALTTVAISVYALLTKVFPAASTTLGRLQAPLGYWNALGVTAAMGIVPCLWGWGRRGTSPVLRGLTVPALAILISVVVLSYSRSAVVVAVIAAACWVAFVPRRLSAAAALGLSALGAAVITGWALSKPALTADNQLFAARTSAGHTFGVVVLVCVLALTAAGIGAARWAQRRRLSSAVRRRIGTVLVVGVALLPVAGIAGLAASSRGLTGEVSHAWTSLTSVNSTTGNSAARLGSLGSSRPLYWGEGIKVGDHALLKGVGALGYGIARTRYTTNADVSMHAHSYLVQTFADLGLIGVVLSLALLVAWGLSAARAVALGTRWATLEASVAAEREGLVALLLVALAFGLQSAIDWTWYFPGVAVPALLCAGWLSGRGPLASRVGMAAGRASIFSRPAVGGTVTALAAVSVLCAWLIWQPLSSADSTASAENAAVDGRISAAFAEARDAAGSDPLALQPLFVLSELYQRIGEHSAARSELVSAVQLQPENFSSWFALGSFDLQNHQPQRALPSLRRAYKLDPTSLLASEALAQARAEVAASGG